MQKKKQYTTGEFAKKANVSIRTIHHYNNKKLITPSFVSDSGYCYYSDEDFARLQKILTLKHLGFSLEEIRTISLNEEDADFLRQSFELQLDLVRKRIAHLQFVEKSIQQTARDFDETGEVDWEAMTRLIQIVEMEKDLVEQYKDGENIKSRIHLHNKYSRNKQGWFPWLFSRIDTEGVRDVLELGCGDGTFWKMCAGQVPDEWQIVLSDVSRGMLDDAAQNLWQIPRDWSFLVADCQKIPCEDSIYDIVIANYVLFYPTNLQAALGEIYRVLRPGGMLYCATYGSRHMKEISDLVKEFDESISLSRVALYENFGLENGEEKLRECFSDVRKEEYPDCLEVSEVEPLLDYIISCHGNQRERLVPKYEAFREFLQRKLEREGAIRITKQAGVFIARKEQNNLNRKQ